VQERLREADALLVALGKRVDRLVADRHQVGEGDHAVHVGPLRPRVAHAADLRDESEELGDRHLRVRGGILGEVAQLSLHGHGVL
jgi:hypothetical protein